MISVNTICDALSMESMGDRLRKARIKAGIPSARQAAQRYGWKESTYAAHENGQNDFDDEAARRYGHAFKVSPGWLLTGDGSEQVKNIARVMGQVGAGAEISPDEEQVPPEGLFEIEVPFPIPDDAVAFEVAGESMWPRYDPGDVVVCWRVGTDPKNVIGWEAAVRTADGRRFLKRILEGAEPETFDLESFNAPPIRNVMLDWVGQINAVVRSGQWRKLDDVGRRRQLRKVAAR